MASLSKADSRRMYSWWWNSHISPKNSKWLHENLSDVDIKVKAMIKLIEEDADSFARRAEMYYKKRPELMKLVEELYRAYRALAEKYDHATGALRQAHKTMSEAFPNQVPAACDDSVPNSPYDSEPQTPDSRTITIPCFDPVDFKDGSTGTARKALSFSDSEYGNNKPDDSEKPSNRSISQFESVEVNEKELVLLKEALVKLEDEKEAGMKQYLDSLDKLSKLESEILKSQEDSRELDDRASKAEAECRNLKEMIQRLEAEKEESLELYHQSQKKIDEINEQHLKDEIERLKDERDAAYDHYKQFMNLQSDLEKKLLEAEKEIETLKLAILKLTKEKEAQDVLHQQCMETISSLELRLVCAEEETEKLKAKIDNGISLLKDAEEQRGMLEKSNRSLQLEVESMGVRIGTQNQEITEKQKELGRLWTCIQEERIRFVEAETAFQTLQQLHAQSQEELRSMAGEIQNRAQHLRDIESRNQVLEGEIQKKIEENKNLSELNLSSTISLKEMQVEINSLKASNEKLEEEVDLRVDQRNALQQEIYCLKEELNELNKKHRLILQQVAYVGLDPESLGSSIKDLQDEKSSLLEEWQKEKTAKAAVLEKLEIMGQLLERNVVLENSLSDLGTELEGVRGKLKSLEESYQSLLEEKSDLAVEKANLLGQLQVTTDNLSQVSEKNTVLENSLFDAHVKLEVLKQKSKNFEDSCQLLAEEKSALITEKGTLVSQMESTEKNLMDLESKYTDIEEKYLLMEKERESTLQKVEELNVSLVLQHQEHVTFAEKNGRQLHAMRSQIQLLQEESQNKSREIEQELDKSFESEIEIVVLLNCAQDLEEKNFSLFNDCHKLQEASKLSESLIHVLKQEKNESQIKIKSLSDQNNRLKDGMHQLLKAAGLSLHPGCEIGREQACFSNIQQKIEGNNRALIENEENNMELVVETTILVALLTQFKTKLMDLEVEKCAIEQELGVQAEKILGLQNEVCKLSEMNKELKSKLIEGDINESGLRTQLENIQCELSVVQEAFRTLQTENADVLEEKKSLLKDNVQLKNKVCVLEEENDIIISEVLSQGILSQTLKNYIDEKHEELSLVEKNLKEVVKENLDLRNTLEKSEHEFRTVQSVCVKLNSDLVNGNSLLQLKEKELMIFKNDKKELSETVIDLRRENNILFYEVLSQGIFSQTLKNHIDEKHEELSLIEKRLEEVINENLDLRKTLEKSERECRTVQSVCDRLSLDIVNGNNLLQLKEKELKTLEKNKKELSETVADLQRENKQVIMTKDQQGKQILELLEDNDHLNKESRVLEVKVQRLTEHLETTEEKTQLLEKEGLIIYGDLQTYIISQILLQQKISELADFCLSLQNENNSKDLNAELLKERSTILECENVDLKACLGAYGAAIESLRDSIISLENQTCVKTKVPHSENENEKGGESATLKRDAFVDLQDLQSKLRVIEMAVAEMQTLSMQQQLHSDAKLESAMMQIEELSQHKNSSRPNGKTKSTSEISEADPKDIMLDQASECSSYSVSKRGLIDGEIWETTDDSRTMFKHHPTASEVSLDNILEVSRRFKEPREDENKRKVLERLNSDVQKLTNLQITIEDLKRNVEITSKSRRGKAMIECESLKEQLIEAESAIDKLYELNARLVQHIEGNSDKSSTSESGETAESMRSKKVSEQARRVSEQIGRMQIEIKKIQFKLVKLDDENEPNGKKRSIDTKKRVVLKDYLYSGGRMKTKINSNNRRKKGHFCGCAEPSTKGD